MRPSASSHIYIGEELGEKCFWREREAVPPLQPRLAEKPFYTRERYVSLSLDKHMCVAYREKHMCASYQDETHICFAREKQGPIYSGMRIHI
jgi:hypothetical protein